MILGRIKVVTNNPKVATWAGFSEADEMLSGGQAQVIARCRDLVHLGFRLVTHPMAGSLKPGENPFRSVALEPGNKLDHESLSMIESAIDALRKFPARWDDLLPADKPLSERLENIRDDFMTVDFSLFISAMEGKPWQKQFTT